MTTPDIRGLGLYIRAMSRSSVRARVERMADNGIKFAAIGSIWQDVDKTGKDTTRFMNSADMCRYISDELMRVNIEPWVWGYPYKQRHVEFVRAMNTSSTSDTKVWLLDPELGMKDKEHDIALANAVELFWACVEANPYRSIGVTSYGIPLGHPTFPWDGFMTRLVVDPLRECDFVSPQLYYDDANGIRRGMQQYKDLGGDVFVPSFATYKKAKKDGKTVYPRMTETELTKHFEDFVSVKEEFNIKAMIGWSEVQVSTGGWKAIKKYADVFK